MLDEERRAKRNAQARERYARNPDKQKARSASYRKANLEEVRRKERERYVADPARRAEVKARAIAHQQANPEMARARRVRWAKEHPEANRNNCARRRAREHAAERSLTYSDWLEILDYFEHRCAYCGDGSRPLEQEHMTPLGRGGNHSIENVVPACVPCNRGSGGKGSSTVLEFLGYALGVQG